MSLVLMNNHELYITHSATGAIRKTQDLTQADDFKSLENVVAQCNYAPASTKGYYAVDTETGKVYYINGVKKKKSRKAYSQDTRQLLYERAEKKCELCGRKILLKEMTIDHVVPLSMGGLDDVNNLACTCQPCNLFKGNILPDNFLERISLIYLYQMKKKHGNKIRWKIILTMLNGLSET